PSGPFRTDFYCGGRAIINYRACVIFALRLSAALRPRTSCSALGRVNLEFYGNRRHGMPKLVWSQAERGWDDAAYRIDAGSSIGIVGVVWRAGDLFSVLELYGSGSVAPRGDLSRIGHIHRVGVAAVQQAPDKSPVRPLPSAEFFWVIGHGMCHVRRGICV